MSEQNFTPQIVCELPANNQAQLTVLYCVTDARSSIAKNDQVQMGYRVHDLGSYQNYGC